MTYDHLRNSFKGLLTLMLLYSGGDILKTIKRIFPYTGIVLVSGMPYLAGMLGVSNYAAKRIVDAIVAGAGIWTIIALVIASGGSAAIAFTLAKTMIKRLGTKLATTW